MNILEFYRWTKESFLIFAQFLSNIFFRLSFRYFVSGKRNEQMYWQGEASEKKTAAPSLLPLFWGGCLKIRVGRIISCHRFFHHFAICLGLEFPGKFGPSFSCRNVDWNLVRLQSLINGLSTWIYGKSLTEVPRTPWMKFSVAWRRDEPFSHIQENPPPSGEMHFLLWYRGGSSQQGVPFFPEGHWSFHLHNDYLAKYNPVLYPFQEKNKKKLRSKFWALYRLVFGETHKTGTQQKSA